MTIRDMESRYRELREKFITGAINREIFEAQVAQLRYQDDHGRHWAIGLQEGYWHVYENGRWRRGKPTPPADPKCPYCGQLLPPGSNRCGLCGKRIPLPPSPPLVTVSSAPELPSLTPETEEKQKISWLRMGMVAAVSLVFFVCLFGLVDVILIATKTKGLPSIAFSGWSPGDVSSTATPSATLLPATTSTQPASPTQPVPTPTRNTSQPATPAPSGTLAVQTPFESTALGFRLLYPTGWVHQEKGSRVALAAHRNDLEQILQNPTDGRAFLVNAGADLASEDTPQAILEKAIDDVQGQDILIGQVQTSTLDTASAAGVLMSFTPVGQDVALKTYLLAAFHEEQPYLIMAIAPEEHWRVTWPAYQEMLQSFRFVEPPATPTPTRTTPSPTTTPRRTTQPQPTRTIDSGTGFQYQQDGAVEFGPGDCKGTAMVWGYVNDFWGQPIDGIYLFVWFEGGDWGPAPQVTRTDVKGVYRLQLLTGQKGTYRVMVIKGWQDRTPLSAPSDAIEVSDYCEHSSFRLNWRQAIANTPTPTQPPQPTVVSDYAFMLDGDIRLSEPKCGRLFQVQGRISGLDEFAGQLTIKVRSPDDVVQNFPEAIQPDGTYNLPTLPTYYTGNYLIWLEDKTTRERLSDHVQFSGTDPCLGSVFEINWKRRK